jgi:phytoene synthase
VLYAEIGNEVERNGFDSISQRAVVSASKKLSRVASVGAVALAPAIEQTMPPLPEAKFLVDALIAQHPGEVGSLVNNSVPWWNLGARVIRVIELFDRLERREQLKRVNP